MKMYKLDHAEYVRIVRTCATIADDYPHESTLNILMDLLHVRFDYENLFFEVPEDLMRRVAIANMCDMAIIQFNDSDGDIDYAMLGNYSKPVLLNILYQYL